MGHTDVVPADEADGWTRDPFGGELVDGEVWGRGAVDMLNQTASMALTFRRLADEGFRPRGDLVFWAVPDEENGGLQGAKQVIETNHDLVRTDFALTEVGGAARRTPNGLVVDASVSDKGMGVVGLVFRGRQSHASLPHGADNPVLKAAEAIRRIDDVASRRAHLGAVAPLGSSAGLRCRPGGGPGRPAIASTRRSTCFRPGWPPTRTPAPAAPRCRRS